MEGGAIVKLRLMGCAQICVNDMFTITMTILSLSETPFGGALGRLVAMIVLRFPLKGIEDNLAECLLTIINENPCQRTRQVYQIGY